jgi:glucose-6-phosphate isomerase
MAGLGEAWWNRYCEYLFADASTGLSLDLSNVGFPEGHLDTMSARMDRVFAASTWLETGQIADVNEQRRVGHYWLRTPALAPNPRLTAEIEDSWTALSAFVERVRRERRFRTVIHVGIGGSATGPQLLCEAWRGRPGGLAVHMLDNADPDGVHRVLAELPGGLDQTLVSVVSKSGFTPTPWQVMLELERAYARAGVDFASHAVATTVAGSELDRHAQEDGWLATFPLWDWVGGLTSVTSLVGLLPAALAGADPREFLAGAAAMDATTRVQSVRDNPAALLALAWHWLGDGRGDKNMVVLPYRDQLTVLPRWIQQLVMESVGKAVDRTGRTVRQGLTVYGYKGVTDQHTYMQQLRDGRIDFFVTFVGTHRGEVDDPTDTEPGGNLADHLFGGLVGSAMALRERGRPTIVIMLPDYDERSLGALVALYERAVGLYAELIDINAYHQTGIDKYTALPVLALQDEVLAHLAKAGEPMTAYAIADAAGHVADADVVHRLLDHLAAARADIVGMLPGRSPRDTRYVWAGGTAHG